LSYFKLKNGGIMGRYIEGKSRHQLELFPARLDEWIEENHPARVIDKFVDNIDMDSLGLKENNDNVGRPRYSPFALIKVLIYCYSIGIRSSRKIERLAGENMAVHWLTRGLKPDYRTIARFRSNNAEALKGLLTETIKLYIDLDLYNEDLKDIIFIDGTKMYSDSNGDRIINPEKVSKKVDRILKEAERIDEEEDKIYGKDNSGWKVTPERMKKLEELLKKAKKKVEKRLEKEEKSDKELKAKIERLEKDISSYQYLYEEKRDKKDRVNLTDPDARLMKHRLHGSHASYNVQISVDGNRFIIGTDVANKENDYHQLTRMVKESISNLKGKREIKKCVADKGYYNANEMREVMNMGIDPIVKKQHQGKRNNKYFGREDFVYDKNKDVVICPGKKELTFNGIIIDKGKEYRRYRCSEPICKSCSLNHKCIRGKKRKSAKTYTILNDKEYLEKHEKIMNNEKNKEIYRKRKEIVEPVIGTVKRDLNFTRFSLRGIEKARGEFTGLISTVYNIRKLINLAGFEKLMRKMEYNTA
jgi:transposase